MQNLNPIINPNIFPCIGGLNSLCFLTYHFLTNTDMTVIVVKVCRVCRFIYFSFDVDYIVLLQVQFIYTYHTTLSPQFLHLSLSFLPTYITFFKNNDTNTLLL